MGKVDDLRALREARYARMQTPATVKKVQRAKHIPEAGIPSSGKLPEETGELCGHRAISGKTCIRPLNHTEKNHRYGPG